MIARATGKAMTMPDLLSIVEAAYSVDCPASSWTDRLLGAADGAIGAGLPGFASMFEAHPDGTITIDRDSAAGLRQPLAAFQPIFDGLTSAPPGWLSSYLLYGGGVARCLMTSEVDPSRTLTYRDDLARQGVHDGVNVVCVDLDRRGVLLSLGVPARTSVLPSTRGDLVRIATHILAALRLRARLATGPDQFDRHHAVLLQGGKLLHAEGAAALPGARRALQAAVRDVERARTFLRRRIPRALDLWKGLVSARWTLVDRFESDGKKYVVACENLPHAAAGFSMLTPTERSVVSYAVRGLSTKEIAYTLGISPTTVRILLMRAARRIGARSREGLLDLARRDVDLAKDTLRGRGGS
jgi:DNA-binding CsgD family transcriptional regulator